LNFKDEDIYSNQASLLPWSIRVLYYNGELFLASSDDQKPTML